MKEIKKYFEVDGETTCKRYTTRFPSKMVAGTKKQT